MDNCSNPVAITGASAMIGATLTKRLVQAGQPVTAIIRPGSKNRANLPDSPLVTVVECPLDRLGELARMEMNCRAFYHFGWDGTFGESRNDFYLQNLNARYALDALALAKAWNCGVFIGAGSQAEYGRADGVLSPHTPVNPETGYGIGKYAAGRMSALMARQFGIRHIWVRILSVYGPMDGASSMIMTAIRKLLKGEKPSFTAGGQMWDYLYSGDAVRALDLLRVRGMDQSVYCLGSGSAMPLSEYIKILRDCVDPALPVGLGEIPYSENQVMHLRADIAALTTDTGFIPETPFKEGVTETISWVRTH